mmetsp:Transcript_42299/g.119605  ORF Transcript_42299/g.119605 Transcript_42299/m.119605 type:complete len:213 (-) Transcript_42299:247-885(-)
MTRCLQRRRPTSHARRRRAARAAAPTRPWSSERLASRLSSTWRPAFEWTVWSLLTYWRTLQARSALATTSCRAPTTRPPAPWSTPSGVWAPRRSTSEHPQARHPGAWAPREGTSEHPTCARASETGRPGRSRTSRWSTGSSRCRRPCRPWRCGGRYRWSPTKRSWSKCPRSSTWSGSSKFLRYAGCGKSSTSLHSRARNSSRHRRAGAPTHT